MKAYLAYHVDSQYYCSLGDTPEEACDNYAYDNMDELEVIDHIAFIKDDKKEVETYIKSEGKWVKK